MRIGSDARHEREAFLIATAKAGMPEFTARIVLRHARTLARLAEAQCNGDWPADNGQRRVETCTLCESSWAPSTLTRHTGLQVETGAKRRDDVRFCQDCRTVWRLKAALTPGWSLEVAGDPRGYVVTVISPAGQRIGVA